MPKTLFVHCRQLLMEAWQVYLTLLKILVPALLVVEGLIWTGADQALAWLLAPVMGWVGLPVAAGLVWATTLLTNIYAGMVVFFALAPEMPLTTAQVTVLGTLMIIGHALPVEGAVARKAGAPWWLTLLLRVGGAILLAWLLHLVYQTGNWLQAPNQLAWQPAPTPSGVVPWLYRQGTMLATIFAVILGLMVVLRLLRRLGIERLFHALIYPLLRAIGLGRNAANTTVIGLTLGLSFGAGLLIRDARSGHLSHRDAVLTLSFLGLCHSLIEDTLLILMLGADLSGILWARLAFALATMALVARLYPTPTAVTSAAASQDWR
ncbi:hypothetical protein [Marinobacter xestospongiae]|uniref:Nucleoside recognition n=1 Tax=Marinobacter xestospongiae TaxID=994319 RepID=A0ABU3VUL5_9GAMM|nr:hypothetical protein [Marinobacter xestospongiae]MDV2077966.1 hypothetical protein [Marinobacter xestospongiae]